MASIGSYTVQIWKGEMKGPRRRLSRHERNGINGTGMLRQAYKCEMSAISTIETVANAAAANQREADYLALEGTEVAVVDCDGISHEKAMVFRVDTTKAKRAKILGGASSSDTYEVQATWQLMLPYTTVKKGGVTQ
jgi:hypothetical protein